MEYSNKVNLKYAFIVEAFINGAPIMIKAFNKYYTTLSGAMREIERLKKQVCKAYKDKGLYFTIKYNNQYIKYINL